MSIDIKINLIADKERASAQKNMATTCDRLSQDEAESIVAFQLSCSAVAWYAMASDFGKDCMRDEWLDKCLSLTYQALNTSK